MTEKVPHNTFLVYEKPHQNFELRFKVRLVKGKGFMNSGIQVRSQRLPNHHEMIGYQVDAGIGWWGKLYDESRRKKVIAEPVDPEALAKVVHDWDEWNEYRVLAEGKRIRSWINGVAAIDYTEKDTNIPLDGVLGFQAHGGGQFLVQFKDVEIKNLPPTAGVKTWKEVQAKKPKPKKKPNKVAAQTSITSGPKTPEEERKSFQLPEGFVAELVTSEEQGVGKPITVAWDASGRMWTMTAYEYPVDANENKEEALALYERGGKDKVLVFDEPYGPGPHTPRVWAEGLAIPLGLLPEPDGKAAFVQHGTQIRRYEDSDGDGKADRHEAILEGFGVQDSHLFPHQFEFMPGGWITVAQGLFNYSKVRRPGSKPFANGETEITFNQTKLARFRPDGSEFELLTAGPNNIWGLVMSREGEWFLQEANDLGMPVVEYIAGAHYRTGSREKLREYAPVIPPSTKGPQMGGTGLSGLALAEDEGSPFAEGHEADRVFYVANPITNRIQIVTATETGAGHYTYEKQEDFLVSTDKWFRPVAIHFGPDGCLYIVDWYNKIISHNEVPRAHPDRDKTRGRIWRIRHQDQELKRPVDLTALSAEQIVTRFNDGNARVARMAWQLAGSRSDFEVAAPVDTFKATVSDSPERALGMFWALEQRGALGPEHVRLLGRKGEGPFWRGFMEQALRGVGEAGMDPGVLVELAEAFFTSGPNSIYERSALANAARQHPEPGPELMAMVARLGEVSLPGNDRLAYNRNFERYLARWAMETHRATTVAMLNSEAGKALPVEARLLAIAALEPGQAAVQLLAVLPDLDRSLNADEIALLSGELKRPEVQEGFRKLLLSPERQVAMLGLLRKLDVRLVANPELAKVVEEACKSLLDKERNAANQALVVEVARRFRIASLGGVVADWTREPGRTPQELVLGLGALREMSFGEAALFTAFLKHADPAVKREALMGYAACPQAGVVPALAERWSELSGAQRQVVVDGLVSTKEKAVEFAKLAKAGKFEGLDGVAVEKLGAVLGREHPSYKELLASVGEFLRPVLQLDGNPAGRAVTNLDLVGPFTVETWIKIPGKIDNNDNILGRSGNGPDLNFFGGIPRLYVGRPAGDVVVANRPVAPGTWTHFALTRDDSGRLQIYLDGEPSSGKGRPWKDPITGLNIGETNPGGGCKASYMEMRIWDRARTAEEIRRDFRTSYAAGPRPDGLRWHLSTDLKPDALEGGAVVVLSDDYPPLVSAEEAVALEKKFARFRTLAGKSGDVGKGKDLFAATCQICHQVKGQGIAVGPDLSGAGAMGTEALLRNILTPNAQLESGYYRHDITLKDGTFLSGFVPAEDGKSLTLRRIGADERVISKSEIKTHKVSRQSLMPPGLIDGFTEQQVADLFAYLNSLR